MANISLRAYRREIEDLISHGRIDEVIAHCRHILKFYPKDVAVYRLLAKAYLESQRYSDATDIFQRVLSVVPDDFVAHVGISIIREDEGNMDAGIWHMERAFESQPSNSAIRDELRRLFGKRDGMEPPKIRLTRGALARMYAQGNLYQQSIGELRAALADEPQRFDLQVLLARMYYMNGQRVEAAEMSNTLISKLPFCLEANRILAEILYDSDRGSEAEVYHQRVKVIDPYAAHASPDNLSTDDVPEDTVTLMRLDWQPGQELTELDSQPGWAASLGLDLGGRGGSTEELPDWLTDDDDETQFMTEDSAVPDFIPFGDEDTQPEPVASEEDQPEASMDFRDTLPPEGSPDEEAPAEADELIPGWMKDAGWATSTGEPAAETQVFGGEGEPGAEDETEEIASAEIPDWLADIAPADEQPGGEPIIQTDDEMSGEIPSWLSSRPPGPTDSVVMWLQNKPEEEDLPPTTGDLEPLETPEVSEEDVPDWLQSVAAGLPAVPASPEPKGEADETEEMPIPEAFEQDAAPEPLSEMESEEPVSESLDWMAALEKPAEDSIEDTKPRRITPDIVDEGEEESAAVEQPVEPEMEPVSEEMGASEAAFFEVTADEEPDDEEDLVGEITAVLVQDEVDEAKEEAEPVGMFDETIIQEPAFEEAAPEEPVQDIPDWLREMEDEVLAGEPALEETPETAAEDEDVPDWLRGLEEEPAAADPLFDQVEEEVYDTPDVPIQAEATPVEEVPDWLREMEQTTPSVEAPSVSEMGMPPAFEMPEAQPEEPTPAEADPAEPVPDWLAEAMTEDIRSEVEDAVPTSVEDETLEAAFSGEMPDMDDQDAAIAWLESLAAKQGVAEEELVTDPEDRRETPPEWVTESMSGFEDIESMAAEEAADVQPAMPEPLPDQPDWMTETLIGDTLVPGQDVVFEEEEALEEPAVEEWSLDTLEELSEIQPAETESEQPAETRQLEPEALGMPSMPAEDAEPDIFAEEAIFDFEDEGAPEIGEGEVQEEPVFSSPGETQQLDVEQMAETPWPAKLADEEDTEEEVVEAELPSWLGEMADVETSESMPQPATTRELDFDLLGEVDTGEMAFEDELEGIDAAEPDEPEPEWMRDTGIPEAALESEVIAEDEEEGVPSAADAMDEPAEAVPEWMRDTGVPEIVFEASTPDEPVLEGEEEPDEVEPEWMLETALPSEDAKEEPAFTEAIEEEVAEPAFAEVTEDWMLETALPDELQDAVEAEGEVAARADDFAEVQAVPLPAKSDKSIRYEEMLAEAKSSLNMDVIDEALSKYNRLIRRRRHLETIIGDLEEAVYRHPVNTDILETLGDAYVKSNSLQNALDTYSKAEDLLRS